MFPFYGSKWKAAPKYPKPKHETIVEPFAGSACYSLCYPDRQIILVEKDPVIAGIWKWLISVDPEEIMRIPLKFASTDDLEGPQELRWFMGFWAAKADSSPRKKCSPWCRWNKNRRTRVASQVQNIRHWKVIHGDYFESLDIPATWFIDPPYIQQGKRYRYGASQIDYESLGSWCRQRQGQVIVCEFDGAKWLPFTPFLQVKGTILNGKHRIIKESVWIKE